MGAQHTPGPWAIGEDGDVWAASGTHCVSITPDTLDNEANARLIAAAPDLLEALRALLEQASPVADVMGVDDDFRNALGDAAAAIAKSEGR